MQTAAMQTAALQTAAMQTATNNAVVYNANCDSANCSSLRSAVCITSAVPQVAAVDRILIAALPQFAYEYPLHAFNYRNKNNYNSSLWEYHF